MFKRLHHQMTFFCALITSIIMIAMSVISTLSYEHSLINSEHATFINDLYSMIANLENQSVISYEWIAKMEKDGQYILALSNNGLPILYDELQSDKERGTLIEKARQMALDDYQFDLAAAPGKNTLTRHTEFTLSEKDRETYYVSACLIPKDDRYLSALIIRPLDNVHQQIFWLRLRSIVLNLIGIILLFVFSYFFTKRLIAPIRRSKEQQTQFVALASHELRTPLAVMLSSLSAMKKANKNEAERFQNTLEIEGHRMSRLVDDLLSLAKADNSSFSMQFERLELDTLVLEAFEKFDVLANKKGICISVELPEGKIARCIGDRGRLEQVLSILLDNAINYTPQNGDIILVLAETKTHLEIRVADNGPGIPNNQKDQIWERFYRIDTSRSERKHFGLGLAIAKEIITAHKGTIRIEDTPETGGASFIITLPTAA